MQSKSRKAEQGGTVKEHLLITRYSPERVAKGEMLSVQDICDILRIPLIGVIPESQNVLQASNAGEPVIHQDNAAAAEAYKDVIARLLGENREMRFLEAEKKGFLKRLFDSISDNPKMTVTVDLPHQTVINEATGEQESFEINGYKKTLSYEWIR